MARHIVRPRSRKNGSGPKSSPEARSLIQAVIGRKPNQRPLREAARLLQLPNHAQMIKMLSGKMKDTPAMKAALRRADKRAERAWRNVNAAPQQHVDEAALTVVVEELECILKYLKSLLTRP